MRPVLCTLMSFFGLSAFAEDDYFPMVIGSEWTMTAKVDSAASGRTFEYTFYRSLEGAVERNGKTYYRYRTWTEGLPKNFDSTRLLRKDETAYYYIEDMQKESAEQIEVLLPLKIGTSWQQKLASLKLTSTVVGIEAVEAGGKNYMKCYHLRRMDADAKYTEDIWDAPGIGPVKSETVVADGTKIVLLLNEFKPGK
jgi:hypothetical protein